MKTARRTDQRGGPGIARGRSAACGEPAAPPTLGGRSAASRRSGRCGSSAHVPSRPDRLGRAVLGRASGGLSDEGHRRASCTRPPVLVPRPEGHAGPDALGGDLRPERHAREGVLAAGDAGRRRPRHGRRDLRGRRPRADDRRAHAPDSRRAAARAGGVRGARRRDLRRPPGQPAPGGVAGGRLGGVGGRGAHLVGAGDGLPAVRAWVPLYLTFMACAGVIADFGLLTRGPILVVGAMALSPDLLPLCATCVGIVGRRPRLAGRAFTALVVGLAVTGVAAYVVTALLRLGGYPPANGSLGDGGLGVLPTVNVATLVVAAVAGVA